VKALTVREFENSEPMPARGGEDPNSKGGRHGRHHSIICRRSHQQIWLSTRDLARVE
jgi:hypothetical protein